MSNYTQSVNWLPRNSPPKAIGDVYYDTTAFTSHGPITVVAPMPGGKLTVVQAAEHSKPILDFLSALYRIKIISNYNYYDLMQVGAFGCPEEPAPDAVGIIIHIDAKEPKERPR